MRNGLSTPRKPIMEHKNHTCSCNCKTRIQALEQRIAELTETLTHHLAQKPTVFWSWDEITAYCRKPRRTLVRYVKEQGFPVCRVGAFVISSPGLIDSWIVARSQRSREKRARKTNRDSYMQRYWEGRAATQATAPHTPASAA